ncbi:MAG: hydrolase, partial [Candidatus Kapabacteria bacterium]|nr:hydrolase [Candidatus Kapabacteria bacterium]
PMNTGGKWKNDWGSIQCTIAHHSSGLPDGTYGGSPMGFSLTTNDGRLHYSSDTALHLDMQLLGRYYRPDWCVLPVGDNFTMGYEDALIASNFLECSSVIGVHFDTFEYIEIDHEAAVNHFAEHGKLLYLPEIGDVLDLERVH